MGDFSKLMDTSMAENMAQVKRSAANGSNADKISKQHTQLTKIFQNDSLIDNDHFGKK